MDFFAKPALMILVFGLLVVFHEFGHYIVARWMGVKVLAFSIGFGPTMVAWRRGDTEYAIRWLPLGGFVRMLGDDPMAPLDDEVARDPMAFQNKPVWRRSLIIAAGPLFNFVLPLLVLFGSALVYENELVSTRVGTVVPGGPAAEIGLQAGDRIRQVAGAPVESFDDLVREVSKRAGQPTELVFERAGKPQTKVVTPREVVNVAAAEVGLVERVGRILLYPGEMVPTVAVTPDSPAYAAGLRSGDRIRAVNGKPVQSWGELERSLASAGGRPITVSYSPLALAKGVARASWRESFRNAHKGGQKTAQLPAQAAQLAAQTLGLQPGYRLVGPMVQGSQEDTQVGLQPGDELLQLDGADLGSLEDAIERQKKPLEAVLVSPDYKVWSPEQRQQHLQAAAAPRALLVRHTLRDAERTQLLALVLGTAKPSTVTEKWLVAQPGARMLVERGWWDRPATWQLKVQLDKNDRPDLALDLASLVDRNTPEMVSNPRPIRHAMQVAGEEFLRGATVILVTVRELFRGNVPVKEVGGVVRMAQMTSEAADHGAEAVLRLIAWLSINLGILNLLPIPLVDGGHLLFLAIEAVRRRPASLRTRQLAAYAGLTFLGILFLVVMKNDLQRVLMQ
ncbi:MAG: RIP metalloprotease RseP [Deltaproteobacteria bacterium]|nr:RIP metalloprotease RseP [Deltaproteobacteria bacterium]